MEFFTIRFWRKHRKQHELKIILFISFFLAVGVLLILSAFFRSPHSIWALIPTFAIIYLVTIFGLPYPFVTSEYSFLHLFEGGETDELRHECRISFLFISVLGAIIVLYSSGLIMLKAFVYDMIGYLMLTVAFVWFLFIYHYPEYEDSDEEL